MQYLDTEIEALDTRRTALVKQVAPKLLEAHGVGPHTAATLLVCASDNPERLASEATFARLCGVAPIPSGSGLTDGYHRLHRGGDKKVIMRCLKRYVARELFQLLPRHEQLLTT